MTTAAYRQLYTPRPSRLNLPGWLRRIWAWL